MTKKVRNKKGTSNEPAAVSALTPQMLESLLPTVLLQPREEPPCAEPHPFTGSSDVFVWSEYFESAPHGARFQGRAQTMRDAHTAAARALDAWDEVLHGLGDANGWSAQDTRLARGVHRIACDAARLAITREPPDTPDEFYVELGPEVGRVAREGDQLSIRELNCMKDRRLSPLSAARFVEWMANLIERVAATFEAAGPTSEVRHGTLAGAWPEFARLQLVEVNRTLSFLAACGNAEARQIEQFMRKVVRRDGVPFDEMPTSIDSDAQAAKYSALAREVASLGDLPLATSDEERAKERSGAAFLAAALLVDRGARKPPATYELGLQNAWKRARENDELRGSKVPEERYGQSVRNGLYALGHDAEKDFAKHWRAVKNRPRKTTEQA